MSSKSSNSASEDLGRETKLLLLLAIVQFAHVLDFMIMIPLGTRLMRDLHISPGQFTQLVAAYGFAAGLSGFIGGFFIDKIERKKALLVTYAGFAIATLSCALAPNHLVLMLTRFAAGACGGLVGSIGTAMVADIVPPQRRGRGMGIVMSAFPLASILGIPMGLFFADVFDAWHAPFFMIAILSVPVWLLGRWKLPRISPLAHPHNAWQQMKEIVSNRVHIRCFVLSAVLILGGACVIPFMVPSMVTNVGIPESHLKYIYMAGGVITIFTNNFFGRLSDRFDKVYVLACVSVLAIIITLVVTNLGPSSMAVTLLCTTIFFASMSGRFAPAGAMVTNAVQRRYRGGFMSVNASVQQLSGSLANLLAGLIVVSDPISGRLLHYPRIGIISSGFFALTVFLAWRLRAVAPYSSRPGVPHPDVTPQVPEA